MHERHPGLDRLEPCGSRSLGGVALWIVQLHGAKARRGGGRASDSQGQGRPAQRLLECVELPGRSRGLAKLDRGHSEHLARATFDRVQHHLTTARWLM